MGRVRARRLAGGTVACVCSAVLAAGAAHGEPAPALRGVVLVTIDTLRADRLGAYGGPARNSPHLDALAAEGVLFEQTSAACPATGPSIATLLTGRYRASHGVRRNHQQIDARLTTLAEAFSASGFDAVGAIMNPVVAGEGFAQGFRHFGMPAATVKHGPALFAGGPIVPHTAAVLDVLGERRFFLWLHLMDPHGPYFPPPPYRRDLDVESYRRPEDARVGLGTGNYGYDLIPKYQRIGEDADPASYRARYDAEIRYADALVGQLVALLRARGLWDRVVFVVTADHGEDLGERRAYFQHGWQVYQETVRIPLIVHGPGLPAGRRVRSSVGHVDVMPTLLALAGVAAPAGVEGRSLVPLLGDAERDHGVFTQSFYGNRLTALRRGRWKYVQTPAPPPRSPTAGGPRHDGRRSDGWRAHWPTAAREELYDLDADPGETRNLAEARADVTARFRTKVGRWRRAQLARSRANRHQLRPPPRPLEPQQKHDLEAQLRALGYLE